jgi:hypothetical protein
MCFVPFITNTNLWLTKRLLRFHKTVSENFFHPTMHFSSAVNVANPEVSLFVSSVLNMKLKFGGNPWSYSAVV